MDSLHAVPTGEDHYARIVTAARQAFGPDIEVPPELQKPTWAEVVSMGIFTAAFAAVLVWIVVAWVMTP